MNTVIGATPHPSEGDLIRYLDAELSEIEERRLRAHVDGCGHCNARLEEIARFSRSVSRLVAGTPVAGPDMVTRARALATVRRAHAARATTRRRAVHVALAASVLLVLAIAAPPVQAWLSDRLEAFRAPIASPVSAPVAPVVAAAAERSSVVAFTPRGARFELEVERYQEAGTLTVEFREASRASAQIVGGRDETMLVLPSGLRVENANGSGASYVVVVPADLPQVRISVGGEEIASLDHETTTVPATRSYSLVRGDR